MKKKTFNKILEERAKADRKEKAKREAIKKYNYNRYVNNYQKLVDKEYKRLTKKNIFFKLIISIAIAIIILFLTQNFQEIIVNIINKI